MARKSCSVCNLSPDVRAFAEQAIEKGGEYRKVAFDSKISKNALHRHMTNCAPRQRFYSRTFSPARAEERVIIQWAGGDSDRYWFAGEEVKLREGDVLITVIHEDPPIRNSARFEDAERPVAASVGLSPTDEAGGDHPPDEPDEPKAEIVHNVNNNSQPEPFVAALATNEPPPPPTPCEHIMVRVSGDVQRCQNCGYQVEPPIVVGVRRDWKDQRKHSPFRFARFGRFG